MDTNTQSLPAELQWQAPRQQNHERSSQWYAIGGGAVILMTVYGLFSGAWSLAIVSILCGALYFLVRDHVFGDSTCILNDQGIRIDDVFLPWTEIEGYWFVELPQYTDVRFTPKRKGINELHIQTGPYSPADIRAFIGDRSTEMIEKRERVLDTFSRLLKL